MGTSAQRTVVGSVLGAPGAAKLNKRHVLKGVVPLLPCGCDLCCPRCRPRSGPSCRRRPRCRCRRLLRLWLRPCCARGLPRPQLHRRGEDRHCQAMHPQGEKKCEDVVYKSIKVTYVDECKDLITKHCSDGTVETTEAAADAAVEAERKKREADP